MPKKPKKIPVGRPPKEEGKKAVTFSISMPPEDCAKLDRLRGLAPRGKYIASILPEEPDVSKK